MTSKAVVNDLEKNGHGSAYGWVVVSASTLVMAGFYGAMLSFGVFLKPLLEEFEATRAMASGAMSVVTATSGLTGVILGRLIDRYGARLPVAIGGLIGGVGLILMSRASSLWELYVYFGIAIGIGTGSCWTPLIATVSRWFVEKRVLALGIATSGLTIGNMLVPPIMAYFIVTNGWRHGYILLAVLVWIVAIPVVIVLGRNPPQGTGVPHRRKSTSNSLHYEAPIQQRDWSAGEVARTVPFWMLMITGFVTTAGFYFLTVHIVADATDIGITATSAALILTSMGAGNILGKILLWPLTKQIGSRFTLLLLIALQAFALFLLAGANSLWLFLALGAVFGFGFGATATVRMSMIPEFFGVKAVGTLVGLVGISWALGGITGPIMAGYIFDQRQSYDLAYLAGGLLMIVGLVAAYFLKAPSYEV